MSQRPSRGAARRSRPIAEGGLQLGLAAVDQVEADVVLRLVPCVVEPARGQLDGAARHSISSASEPRAIFSTARR